ncbi:MurR/RpiR family transcriptional regulator [Rhodovulum sp. PH10]|uniref:MurR/RpiR family transcriptional regulator n=1 Tax=Rhodovulum sp. PH10 TaxID=1187851 RepID=UPI00178C4E23|nr:MurR/RpiR family transcriptional regulator [Rhodovulum sp. PH10]
MFLMPAMIQPLEQAIRAHYESLPAGERKIADVLLEMGGDLAAYSATELAGRAGVSKATATRLVRRLGFSDYQDLRQQARSAGTGSPLAELRGEAVAGSLGRHLEHDVAALTLTLEGVSALDARRAVETMVRAKRLWVIGFRNSHALALYARELLVQVKPDVRLLPVPGQTLAEDLSSLQAGDVMLMLAFRRRPPMTGKILRAAKASGAEVVLLADPSLGDVAEEASVVFRCLCRGANLFDCYVGPMSLLNYLCAEVALALGDDAQRQLRRGEQLHDAFGDFGF